MNSDKPLAVPAGEIVWIVEIYEIAEHWSFEVRISAATAEAAKAKARSNYGRGYNIKGAWRA